MAIFILTKQMVGTDALTRHFRGVMKSGYDLEGVAEKMQDVATDVYRMLETVEGDDAFFTINLLPGWRFGKKGLVVVATNSVGKMGSVVEPRTSFIDYTSRPEDVMYLYHLGDSESRVMKMTVEGTTTF